MSFHTTKCNVSVWRQEYGEVEKVHEHPNSSKPLLFFARSVEQRSFLTEALGEIL